LQSLKYAVADFGTVKSTAERKLDVVPTISVKDGEVVVVRKKRYERLEDEDGSALEPAMFVEQVLKQYERALLVDINGIEHNRPQVDLIQDIAELGEVWLDAGTRHAEGIIDILVCGVEAVVLGTKTIAGVDQLTAAFEMSENIYLSIDWNDGVVGQDESVKHMSPRSVADIAKNIGVKKLIFTDLGRGPKKRHLEKDIITELTKGPLPLYVGGGVMEADLGELRGLGAEGALLSVLSIVTEAK